MLGDSALRAPPAVHLRCTACLSYRVTADEELGRQRARRAAQRGAADAPSRAARDIGFVFAVRIRQPTAWVRHCVPQLPELPGTAFIPVGCYFISKDVTRIFASPFSFAEARARFPLCKCALSRGGAHGPRGTPGALGSNGGTSYRHGAWVRGGRAPLRHA